MKKKQSPQAKAVAFLESKGWEFNHDNGVYATTEFKRAFPLGAQRGDLGYAVTYLIKVGWFFNTITDLQNLDKARQIYLRNLPKTHI